jgi:hypothetical protein
MDRKLKIGSKLVITLEWENYTKTVLRRRFLRSVWQCGSRILSTHSYKPSLQEKAISFHGAGKDGIKITAKEVGFQMLVKMT